MRWALAAALLLLCTRPAMAQLSPGDFPRFAFRQHPGAQLPLNAELKDENGRTVRLGDEFEGRPAIVVLEYLHCPNLCSLVMNDTVEGMKAAHIAPGRDVEFLGISIDPREGAADAKAARVKYSAQYEARTQNSGWHFLTGDAQTVGGIASVIGFPYRYDPSVSQFAHPAGFVVTTPQGKISRYLLGVHQSPDELRRAVVEAGQSKTAGFTDSLLVLCFGYHPEEGTVAATIMSIVRAGSALALLASALLIGFLVRPRRA